MVGAPSDLRRDDVLLTVDDRSVNEPVPPHWKAGETVIMLVRRGDRELSLAVPVVHWTLAAWLRYNLLNLSSLLSVLSTLILTLVGFFTFSRRPQVPSARALLILCATIGATSISTMLPDGVSVRFNQLAFWPNFFFSYVIWGILLAPALLTFTLHFPQPKRIIQRHRWLGLIAFGPGLALMLVAIIKPSAAVVGWLIVPVMIIASIASLIHSGFTQRDAVSRAQLRWAIGGFVAGLSLVLLTFPSAFGWITNPFLAELLSGAVGLGFAVVGVCLGIAVLRYRLYDIDVIIRRTLIYSVLTLILGLVYVGCIVVSRTLIAPLIGSSDVAIVASTLAIAALFTPLRRRIQNLIDKRFFRRKYDAAKVLAAFGATARDETDLERLNAELLQVVDETMQPEFVGLWLRAVQPRSTTEAARPALTPPQ